jgi:NAD+ synthase (glutamine-hydrolysing)
MTNKLRIVLAQLSLPVGDIAGNLTKHIEAAVTARDELKADVIVFPELSLTGYPPEDLLLRESFLKTADDALQQLRDKIRGIHCIVGHPQMTLRGLQNVCTVLHDGTVLATYAKQRLPNYGVFDEKRYFSTGDQPCITMIHGIAVGLIICEDIWKVNPIKQSVAAGAQIILVPNASPFKQDKHEDRIQLLTHRSERNHVPIAYVNCVDGQDDLIFDGGSLVIDNQGKLVSFGGFFQENLISFDVSASHNQVNITTETPLPVPLVKEERIYQALVFAVREYVTKNRFPGVLIGLSGGIDSALVLAIAVDALGSDRVRAVTMPSRYTADISNEDAALIAKNLNVQLDLISIEPMFQSFLTALQPTFAGKPTDSTEENMQARCRGLILMSISNKTGYLVLTTGNRSELATGYCTLYGDMVGGFAPLKDIPKMMVYALATYRNSIHPVIPQRTIERAPSAELAPDQRDEDALAPYPILDAILEYYLNDGMSAAAITAKGFDPSLVAKVIRLIHRNEYKRRQGAIGPRINSKSFGKDWRYPITHGFKE